MLHVGVRDEVTEQVVAHLRGVKDEGYRQRTATTGIGYLLPGGSRRDWEITPGSQLRVQAEVADRRAAGCCLGGSRGPPR